MQYITDRYLPSKTTFVLMLTMLVGVTSCFSENKNTSGSEAAQRHDRYYIMMSESDKDEFINKADKIKLNDTWDTIINILGAPDIEHELIPKESNISIGVVRLYYVNKFDKDLVNEKLDQVFRMVFNRDGVLVEINSNISGYERNESL